MAERRAMIWEAAREVFTSDPEAYAWANLRKYQNVAFVEDRIRHFHPDASPQNARKQARQLRYCLIQAREYFTAAKAVTLATKPTLQYYGIMSLALAEILFKQSGDSSLDRARQHHRHHGLLFRESVRSDHSDLASAATALRAIPHIDSNKERRGTFELWHRTCQDTPLVGDVHDNVSGGIRMLSCGIVLSPDNVPLRQISSNGVDFLSCLRASPGMAEHLDGHGVGPGVLRARFEVEHDEAERTFRAFVHTSPLSKTYFENCKVEPNWVDRVDLKESPNGGGIMTISPEDTGSLRTFFTPHAASWTRNEARMWPENQPLNEFGYLYIALFIAGNYTRYFPDKWLADVGNSTSLAVAIEELTQLAEWRAPWLCLCELSRTYLVPHR
jgi:hypothetical protein